MTRITITLPDDPAQQVKREAQRRGVSIATVAREALREIVTLAERQKVVHVATLDHRHFRAVRPRHCDALRLLPGHG